MIGENGDPKSEKAYGLYLAGYNNREISEMLEVSVHEAAKLIQGGGGGQPHFATAGGKNIDGLHAAVDKVLELAGL